MWILWGIMGWCALSVFTALGIHAVRVGLQRRAIHRMETSGRHSKDSFIGDRWE